MADYHETLPLDLDDVALAIRSAAWHFTMEAEVVGGQLIVEDGGRSLALAVVQTAPSVGGEAADYHDKECVCRQCGTQLRPETEPVIGHTSGRVRYVNTGRFGFKGNGFFCSTVCGFEYAVETLTADAPVEYKYLPWEKR